MSNKFLFNLLIILNLATVAIAQEDTIYIPNSTIVELAQATEPIHVFTSTLDEFKQIILKIYPYDIRYKTLYKVIRSHECDGYTSVNLSYFIPTDVLKQCTISKVSPPREIAVPYNAFTLHENYTDTIKVYDSPTENDTNCIAIIYPYEMESNAGTEINIISSTEDFFQIQLFGNNFYIRKGNAATYSKRNAPIYTYPSRKAKIRQYIYEPTLLKIVEYKNGWIKVRNIDIGKRKINGWIPPENQCPNQWTPC